MSLTLEERTPVIDNCQIEHFLDLRLIQTYFSVSCSNLLLYLLAFQPVELWFLNHLPQYCFPRAIIIGELINYQAEGPASSPWQLPCTGI